MKFLPIHSFSTLTTSLNFTTPSFHITGSIDLYTTKAAGGDKKLYKEIESNLEAQYESLLRLSASLSPPNSGAAYLGSSLDLSRASPFGPLSQAASRRTFVYLIATLNASHPDYDFSHVLRPSDFRRERSLKAVMNNIDSTLLSLRPQSEASKVALAIPSHSPPATTGRRSSKTPAPKSADSSSSSKSKRKSPTPPKQSPTFPSQTGVDEASQGEAVWGPRMWSLIDKEMDLRNCAVYCWAPEDSVWEGEEGAIWSLNYFFFNKKRKRVAYFYARAIPVMTQSPRLGKNRRSSATGLGDEGAGKRARYWLGDKAVGAQGLAAEDERPDNYDVEEEFDLNDDSDSFMSDVYEDDDESPYDEDDDDVDMVDELAQEEKAKRMRRAESEGFVDRMEL